MTRRATYLLTWGITFLGIGMFFFSVGVPSEWAWLYLVAGVFSIAGATTYPKYMDTLAFMALTVTSALRSFWYLWDFLQSGSTGPFPGALLWLCVAISQVIVAGWPESTIQVKVELDKVKRGVE